MIFGIHYQILTSIDKVINKCGRTGWGPSPTHMKWVYTGITHLKITYGAIMWANKASNHKKA